MKKSINWAIIGPGGIAHQFAKALIAENGMVYAVGARNQAKAAAFAKKFAIERVYTDFEALAADEQVDVVYIATPHSSHYQFIKQALTRGKHVFAEKAITVNTAELEELQALATAKGLILAEAMTIYHMPLYKELQKRIATGKLGNLQMIQVCFGAKQPLEPKNRFFNPELAGGALLDIGTYALTFARMFLQAQPAEIRTAVRSYETGVDEQAGIVLQNDSGEMAVITLTFRANMPQQGIIAFENGFITIDKFSRADEARITYQDGSTEIVQAGKSAEALHYEVKAMESFITEAVNPTAALTADVMALMTNVRKQWGLTFPTEK